MSEEIRVTQKGIVRCQDCGEPMGPLWANHDDGVPDNWVVRCSTCWLLVEAEGIKNTAGPYWGNSGGTSELRTSGRRSGWLCRIWLRLLSRTRSRTCFKPHARWTTMLSQRRKSVR